MDRFIAGMEMLIANPQLGIKTKHPELRIKLCEALIDWARNNPEADIYTSTVNVLVNGKQFDQNEVRLPTMCIIGLEHQIKHLPIHSIRFT